MDCLKNVSCFALEKTSFLAEAFDSRVEKVKYLHSIIKGIYILSIPITFKAVVLVTTGISLNFPLMCLGGIAIYVATDLILRHKSDQILQLFYQSLFKNESQIQEENLSRRHLVKIQNFMKIYFLFPYPSVEKKSLKDEVANNQFQDIKEEMKILPTAKADNLINEVGEMKIVDKNKLLNLQSRIQQTTKETTLQLTDVPEVLYPFHEYQLGEVTYYTSQTFLIGSNFARLALVTIGDKIYPRILYLSGSQGVWRTTPVFNYAWGCFGKGICESDTNLPIEINLSLHKQSLSTNKLLKEAEKKLFDAVVEYGFHENKTYKNNTLVKDLADLIDKEKFHKRGAFYHDIPANPDAIKIPEANEKSLPDFSKMVLSMEEISHVHYGKLTAEVFISKDQTRQYVFYKATDGRVFLASVEHVKDNPLTAYGIRQCSDNLHSLDAPLLEYDEQIPDKYMPSKEENPYANKKKYLSNWNYLREIVIIKMYYSEQGLELPEKV